MTICPYCDTPVRDDPWVVVHDDGCPGEEGEDGMGCACSTLAHEDCMPPPGVIMVSHRLWSDRGAPLRMEVAATCAALSLAAACPGVGRVVHANHMGLVVDLAPGWNQAGVKKWFRRHEAEGVELARRWAAEAPTDPTPVRLMQWLLEDRWRGLEGPERPL